jgi:hypothetical protein
LLTDEQDIGKVQSMYLTRASLSTLQTCYSPWSTVNDSTNMLLAMIHGQRLYKHVTHHDPRSTTLQTCYPPWSTVSDSTNMLLSMIHGQRLSKHVTHHDPRSATLQTCYSPWSTVSDCPNMLLSMIHGQAFWRLTWKLPFRGNSYPLVVMCWTKDEQCLGKTQITHLSNSRAPLSILIDARSILSTCCVYLLNHMLFFSFYLL